MTRYKRRPNLPDAERLQDIFSERQVKHMSARVYKVGKPPDPIILRQGIIEAARAYLVAVASPSRGEVKREIERLISLAESGRPSTLSSALVHLSGHARAFIESRGRGPLPSGANLTDPETSEQVRKQIILLCTLGMDGRGQYIPFVPLTQLHSPKRLAERDFILALRCAMFAATGRVPGRTVHRSGVAPLSMLADECFDLLGVQNINVALILNREAKNHWRW